MSDYDYEPPEVLVDKISGGGGDGGWTYQINHAELTRRAARAKAGRERCAALAASVKEPSAPRAPTLGRARSP